MVAPKSVALVGTGLIGGSIGLALRRAGVTVCGFDRDAERAAAALDAGAVDELAPDLGTAVAVEAAHGDAVTPERETDRPADEAGADERDGLRIAHGARQSAPARSARNAAAPSRKTWCSWSRGRSE